MDRLRRRARLKTKQSRALRDRVAAVLPCELWADDAAVETADADGLGVFLVNGQIHGLDDGNIFLALRGLMKYRPKDRWVTVDMGAVKFVTNGADIMAPGITEADPTLQEGDWCWIRDEKNGQPLAVGKCVLAGAEMGAASKGKAVQNIHFIGDKLWLFDA